MPFAYRQVEICPSIQPDVNETDSCSNIFDDLPRLCRFHLADGPSWQPVFAKSKHQYSNKAQLE